MPKAPQGQDEPRLEVTAEMVYRALSHLAIAPYTLSRAALQKALATGELSVALNYDTMATALWEALTEEAARENG